MTRRLTEWAHRHVTALRTALLTLLITTMTAGTALADEPDLDTAITNGFGKLIKYGRYTAAMIAVILFVMAWVTRAQNSENPHEQQRATRSMVWTGVAFVMIIGYKMILIGLTKWFSVPASSIPDFLWQ